MTVDQLRDFGYKAIPCDCGEEGCHGWQMIHVSEPVLIYQEDGATKIRTSDGTVLETVFRPGYMSDEELEQVRRRLERTLLAIDCCPFEVVVHTKCGDSNDLP